HRVKGELRWFQTETVADERRATWVQVLPCAESGIKAKAEDERAQPSAFSLDSATRLPPGAVYWPCPTNSQFVSAIVGMKADADTVSPFISQPTFCPVDLLRRMTSALPSPSKSPTPRISQLVSAIVGMNAEIDTVNPFINQPMSWPVD